MHDSYKLECQGCGLVQKVEGMNSKTDLKGVIVCCRL